MSTLRRSTALLALALLAPFARADTLVTADGRVIEVLKARVEGDTYRLSFAAGEIVCPKSAVASVEIEGDMSDYQPKDDREREFLERGYVRYRDKWISKERYGQELAEQAEARRQRTAELAQHSEWHSAWELETKHFRMRSNTSPELLAFYGDLLESYWLLMDDAIGIDPTPTMKRTKMAVNVYKRHEEMKEHSGEDEIGDTVLGYFSPHGQSLNFFHDYKDPDSSVMVALHECTHLLTYLIDQDYLPQIWLNEAMADYYGMSSVVRSAKGKLELAPGQLQMDQVLTMQQAIADGKYTKLADLFLIEDEAFDGFQYANAWSFVYFLQNTPEYAKSFNKFFKLAYTLGLKGKKAETLSAGYDDKTGTRKKYSPADLRDALLEQLGVKDLAALEQRWIEFVKAIPIEAPQALYLRGYNRAAFGEGTPQEALADLDAAIAGSFVNGRVYYARALANVRLGEWEQAVADLKKAVELDPLDSTYRAELAWVESGWFGQGDEIVGSDDELADALTQFSLAAALDPENDELARMSERYAELYAKKK